MLQLEPAFFGAVSAVINIQPSIFLTVKTARDQLVVHILAVVSAIAMGSIIGGNPLTMGILTILLIMLYIRLDLHHSISMGIVAAVFVLGSGQEQFLPNALNRTAVIFTGLITAMVVNVVLWPPRYKEQLKEKMQDCNKAVLGYFCKAIQEYVEMENEIPGSNADQKEKVYALLNQVQNVADMLKREGEIWATSTEHQAWFAAMEKWIDYHAVLVEKADGIYDLLPGRLDRRREAGAPPISEEFRAILALLGTGCEIINRINMKLGKLLLRGEPAQPEEISEEYWEKLTGVIEQWQPKLTGSYYLHALMGVAVTANEIKWASRQAKILLAEYASGHR